MAKPINGIVDAFDQGTVLQKIGEKGTNFGKAFIKAMNTEIDFSKIKPAVKEFREKYLDSLDIDIANFLKLDTSKGWGWNAMTKQNSRDYDRKTKYLSVQDTKNYINEYNSKLGQLSDDLGTDGVEQYLSSLKQTNAALAEFIEKRRELEATNAGEEEVEHRELSEEDINDFVSEQNQRLFDNLSNNNIRETIDDFRNAGDASGNLTQAQQEMIEALRETDEEFARFLALNPSATMGAYARAQVVATAKTMLLNAATTALNATLSFFLSAVFQAVITGITSWIHKYDDLREASKNLYDEFQETSQSIDEQIEKIKELHAVLNDETATDNELYDARAGLIDIQRDLIDVYGEQAEGINLLNSKYDEEIERLEEIRRQKAKDAYNESYSAYEDSKKQLGKKHKMGAWRLTDYNIISENPILAGFLGEANTEAVWKSDIADEVKELGFKNFWGDMTFDKGVTITEAIEKYNELIKLIENSNDLTEEDIKNFKKVISEKINNLNSEDYQSWNNDVQNSSTEAIESDKILSKKYSEIEKAIKDYDDDIASNKISQAEEQIDYIIDLQNEIENMDFEDEYIKEHFSELFNDIQNDINKRKFKITFESNSDYAKSFDIFKGYSDIDVQQIGLVGGTEEEVAAYNRLSFAANAWGISIDSIISLLVEEGILFSRNADAAKYTTTSYTSMLSSLEELTEKLEKFDSAQQKILTGSSLTADEVNSLIKMYPQLIDSVERTTSGYRISADKLKEARDSIIQSEKEAILDDINESRKALREQQKELDENQKIVDELSRKSDLTPEENRKLNNAKDIVKNRKKDIEEFNIQLKQQQFLLEQILDPVEDWAAILDTVASKIQSISDKLIAMRSQMFKTGKVNPIDALNFIQEVPNWQDYLTIDSDGAVLKDLDDGQMIELIKKTSGYDSVLDGLNGTINENTVERNKQQEIIDKLEDKLAKNGHLVGDENRQLGLAKNKVAALDGEINNANETIDATETLLQSILEMLKGDVEVNAFNDLIDDLDHIKSMGGMNEDEYLANYKRRFAESRPALEESGSVEAMEAIENAEENIYSMELSQQQRYYERELQQAENAYEDNLISFDEFQKRRMAINEKYYAPGTMLGNTEDGAKQYAANLRENAALGKDGFDKAITDLGRQKELGIISAEEYWAGYKQASEKYLKDVPSLSDEYADTQKELQTTAVTEMYDEELRELDNLHAMGIINDVEYYQKRKELYQTYLEGNAALDKEAEAERIELATTGQQEQYDYEMSILERRYENGEISLSEYLDRCKALWEGYYKDQQQFANEDADTQKELLDKRKQGIQEQIDGLEAASDKETEPYEQQIDALEEIQDKYDDVMDERIEALEDQKKAIEKANKAQEKENDLLEKKRALEKASVRNRLVYAGNGQWEARRDEDAYQDAKADYEEALKEKEIDKLEEAIEALEDEKESRDKAIEKQIKALEETVEKITAPFDNLIKVLTATIAENHNLDPKFIQEILLSPTGQEALETYNTSLADANKIAEKNGIKLTGRDEVTLDDVDKMVTKAAEENNKTADEIAEGLGLSYNKTAETKSDDINNNSTALNSSTKATEDNTSALNGLSQTAVNLKEFEKDMQAEYGLGNVDLTKRPFVSMPDGSTATVLSASEFVWQGDEENGKYVVVHYTPILPDGTILDDDTLNDYLYNTLENSENILDTDKNGLGIVLKVDTDFDISDEDVRSLETDKPTENIMNIIAACDEWDVALHEIQEDWVELKNLASETENAVDNDNIKAENNPTKRADNKDNSVDTSDMIKNTADTEAKSGSKVKPVIYSEWKKRHKLSEYAPHGKDITDMTFEEYLNKQSEVQDNKGSKTKAVKSDIKRYDNGIIPLSEIDPSTLTDRRTAELVKALSYISAGAFKNIHENVAQNTIRHNSYEVPDYEPPVTTVAPQFNCTINIEGSADEKTVERMKNEINSALNEYTTELKASLHRSLINQRYKP